MCVASIASGHFVWIETEAKEGKTLVKSGFGEPEGWDPDLVGKITQTKYWTKSGDELKPLDMKLDEKEQEIRTTVDGAAPAVIVASTEYGVVQFGPSPASMLRYTAKYLAGAPTAWKDSATSSLRVELVAKAEGDSVALQALHLGKPAAGAKIKATNPNGDEVEMTTDDAGKATWKLVGPGKYGCYFGVTTPEEGSAGDKKYAALKDYTTLSFEIAK
ncbi:MAG: hypothetical protein QM775_15370 [Pirellulales bacterium]